MKTRESMANLNICGKDLTRLQRIMVTILTVYRESMVILSQQGLLIEGS